MVRGSRVVFVPVKGKRVDNKMFIITAGVSVGDAVVEDASTAREEDTALVDFIDQNIIDVREKIRSAAKTEWT